MQKELIKASRYYGGRISGWVVLANGQPYHFSGRTGKKDAQVALGGPTHSNHVTAYYRHRLRILRDEAALRSAEYERRKRGFAMQNRGRLPRF